MHPLFQMMHDAAQASGGKLPLYAQLEHALRQAIEEGKFGPSAALPAERQLALELGVSRITVRKAIDALVAEGLLVRRAGSGNFVNGRIEKQFSTLNSFTQDMRARGRTPGSTWLKRAAGVVTPEEALRLDLPPGSPVLRLHRLRCADGTPMCVEYATVAGFALSSPEAVADSLYEALAASGHRPVRARQRLSAVLLGGEQARLLRARDGDAGLCVERLGLLADGRAVEFCRSYYRGDMVDFVGELSA